jgi:RNA polymerase sigma-70 factor, ECF subfamily
MVDAKGSRSPLRIRGAKKDAPIPPVSDGSDEVFAGLKSLFSLFSVELPGATRALDKSKAQTNMNASTVRRWPAEGIEFNMARFPAPILLTPENTTNSIRVVRVFSPFSANPSNNGWQGRANQGVGDVTQMLISYGQGNREALDALLPLVYDELRVIARSYLRQERPDHTLQPTGLVHEAYLRLINQQRVDWRNRAQFFGLAASMMRRILVNHAESKRAQKRGGDVEKLSLDEVAVVFDDDVVDLIALDEVLGRLEKLDKLKSDVVELKFFGGLTIAEIAEVTKTSTATVEREWAFARGWLYNALTEQPRTHEL